MKNKKKMFIFTEVILAILVILVAFMMIQVKTGKKTDKISIIVQNSDDSQWSAFKYGLKMAAMDKNVEVFMVSTGAILTEEEQKKLIKQEIDSGADGIILQPVSGKDSESMLRKFKKNVPLILVESSVSTDENSSGLPVMEPDQYAMGRSLAEELLNDYNGNVKGKTLGLVYELADSEKTINRRVGFEDALEDKGIKICWSLNISSEEEWESVLAAQTTVDFVAALDDASLTLAGKCSLENNLHGSVVYGIGNSTDGVYYLEKNAVKCLVVPDEFMMGYESVSEIARSLQYSFRQPESRCLSYSILRKDQLFLEENQELLYMMSQ